MLKSKRCLRLVHFLPHGHAEGAAVFALTAADAVAGVMLEFLVFGGDFVAYHAAVLLHFVEKLVDGGDVNAYGAGGAVLAVGAAGASAFGLRGLLGWP